MFCFVINGHSVLFEDCMAGDVNLFLQDGQQDIAEIEVMIAGTCINKIKISWVLLINFVSAQ